MKRFLIALLLVLGSATLAYADEQNSKSITIEHAWARATPLGAKTGVVYMTIVNSGKFADKLIGTSTPMAAEVEFHSMGMENGIMRMGFLSVIELKPGKRVTLKPGGSHAMLIDLKERLVEGQNFPLMLEFEKAGKIQVTVKIESLGAMEAH